MNRKLAEHERNILDVLASFERSRLAERVAGVHVPRSEIAPLLATGLAREVTHDYGRPEGLVVARITPEGLTALATHEEETPKR